MQLFFNDVCLKAGLTSFKIDGYTKQNGFVDNTGHAWCAVLIDNTWQLCDPTWDATSPGANTRFFLIPPSDMIESHMPYDPMWQLLNHPVSHQQFYAGNFFTDKNQPVFNYADTIAAWMKMDSLQKFRSVAYRIEQSGTYNKLVKNSLDYAKMNVEFIRQDKDVELYNLSVADLNDAMTIYNNFVQYRNKQFIPAIPENELQTMLNGIDTKLLQAHKKLDEIDKSQATFQIGTHEVRNRLNTLAGKVKEQKVFLTIYLNTPKENRQSLFYNKQVTKNTGK